MRHQPAVSDPNFAKIISTQQSVASSVFSTTARINEANLRRVQSDKMQELLDELRAEEGG